jgi:predicted ATPase
MENNWYVISGGPGTGKTTLIKLLEARGYATIPEMARHCIDEQLALGKTMQDIGQNQLAFQQEIVEHQLTAERNAPKDRVTFFDRGIPDSLAYYRYNHLPEDEVIQRALAGCSYKKVFLLDPLPLVSDYARQETERQQRELCALIQDVYMHLPFPIVHVPVLPVDERVAFILKHVEEK